MISNSHESRFEVEQRMLVDGNIVYIYTEKEREFLRARSSNKIWSNVHFVLEYLRLHGENMCRKKGVEEKRMCSTFT